MPELHRDRLIEPELMAHIGDLRRAGAAPGDERGGIGGKIVQEQKRDHRDAEEDQSRLAEPACQNQDHQPLPRCVGSRRSRKASPTRLKDNAVARMKAPGMKTSHGAAWK